MQRDLLAYVLWLGVLTALSLPLGWYMAAVYEGRAPLDRLLGPLERWIYRLARVDPCEEMPWRRYAWSLLAVQLAGLLLFALVVTPQRWLPWNPEGAGPMSPWLLFNTAASFVTNTNWQAYAGERAMGDLAHMAAEGVQNFLSAATGLAAAVALIRGLVRRNSHTIGNFWADFVRSLVHVLLPLAFVFALVLAGQGVVQSLGPRVHATTLEGRSQVIARAPAASQEAIKLLGTNGGGLFAANSAHPYENPTPLTNWLEPMAELLIPLGLIQAFGRMAGDRRQGWTLYGVVLVLFVAGLGTVYAAESAGNPVLAHLGVAAPTAMEGKEVRFGVGGTALFADATTATSTGAVDAAHESLMPLSALVLLLNMMIGEISPGGVGSGLYTLLLFVLFAVFLGGLMVGRTPEFLGKKVEPREMKLAVVGILLPSLVVLAGTALAVLLPPARAALSARGPWGLAEVTYAFTSAAENNGSAFAGLAADTPFYDLALGLAMLVGRFGVMVPVLALAGSLAAKKAAPRTAGTLETASPLFAGLLLGWILIVGALTFFPVLALGPLVQQFVLGGVHGL